MWTHMLDSACHSFSSAEQSHIQHLLGFFIMGLEQAVTFSFVRLFFSVKSHISASVISYYGAWTGHWQNQGWLLYFYFWFVVFDSLVKQKWVYVVLNTFLNKTRECCWTISWHFTAWFDHVFFLSSFFPSGLSFFLYMFCVELICVHLREKYDYLDRRVNLRWLHGSLLNENQQICSILLSVRFTAIWSCWSHNELFPKFRHIDGHATETLRNRNLSSIQCFLLV